MKFSDLPQHMQDQILDEEVFEQFPTWDIPRLTKSDLIIDGKYLAIPVTSSWDMREATSLIQGTHNLTQIGGRSVYGSKVNIYERSDPSQTAYLVLCLYDNVNDSSCWRLVVW